MTLNKCQFKYITKSLLYFSSIIQGVEMRAQLVMLMDKQAKPLLSEVVARGVGPRSAHPIHGGAATGTSTPIDHQNEGSFMFPPLERRKQYKQQRREARSQGQQQAGTRTGRPGQQQGAQHRQPRGPIVGQAAGTGDLRAAPLPDRDFFVYRVHRDDGEKTMKDYIMKKNVNVRELEKTSHDDAKFNSFKLVVSKDDAEKVADPQFWPLGIHVRRWRDDKNKRENGNVPGRLNEGDESHDVLVQEGDTE